MHKMPKHELPIVPTANLVDIAILLIIFYMACSNFVTKSAGKLVNPKAADLGQFQEPLVIVMIDNAGTITLQGKEIASAESVESSLTELLSGKESAEAKTVMFKCDETVSQEVYEPVMDAIVEAGGTILAVGDKVDSR